MICINNTIKQLHSIWIYSDTWVSYLSRRRTLRPILLNDYNTTVIVSNSYNKQGIID